jgi:hypothetical protein
MSESVREVRLICDGCNVREPFEHRCHSPGDCVNSIVVRGDFTKGPCRCELCHPKHHLPPLTDVSAIDGAGVSHVAAELPAQELPAQDAPAVAQGVADWQPFDGTFRAGVEYRSRDGDEWTLREYNAEFRGYPALLERPTGGPSKRFTKCGKFYGPNHPDNWDITHQRPAAAPLKGVEAGLKAVLSTSPSLTTNKASQTPSSSESRQYPRMFHHVAAPEGVEPFPSLTVREQHGMAYFPDGRLSKFSEAMLEEYARLGYWREGQRPVAAPEPVATAAPAPQAGSVERWVVNVVAPSKAYSDLACTKECKDGEPVAVLKPGELLTNLEVVRAADYDAMRERCEAAEREVAERKAIARRAAQMLIEEIGAPGPENVDETAVRAVNKIKAMRERAATLTAANARLAEELAGVREAVNEHQTAMLKFANEAVCPVNDNLVAGFVSGAYTGWGWARNHIRTMAEKLQAALKEQP